MLHPAPPPRQTLMADGGPPPSATSGNKSQFGQWVEAKRQMKHSDDEVAFVRQRVNKLKMEEAKAERILEHALRQKEIVESARKRNAQRHAVSRETKSKENDEIQQRLQKAKESRHRRAVTVASARDLLMQRKKRLHDRVLHLEEQIKAAKKSLEEKEASRLRRRHDLIREVERDCWTERTRTAERRLQAIRQRNRRDVTQLAEAKEANMKAAAELLVVEADTLRRIAELKRQQKTALQALGRTVNGGHDDEGEEGSEEAAIVDDANAGEEYLDDDDEEAPPDEEDA